MTNPKGYLCLVLHAHLPFVRHPEYEDFLEEDWLYEAITETYIPLLQMMEGLERDGIRWRLTMSLTPTLCSMLADPLLQTRYQRHLEGLIELAHKEVERTIPTPEFHPTARMYVRRLTSCRDLFLQNNGNLLTAFGRLQETGRLEIITCGATHGFLPLLMTQPEAVRAQVRVAVDHYTRCFGRPPRGIWNGECGFYPGLDSVLGENGLKFFFVDTHGVLFASQRPKYGVFAPLFTPGGAAAFGRDMESSHSVWSAEHGYPGDPRYREFYRDIGFDLDAEYLAPYLHGELRTQTGIKYHKITGRVDLRDKLPYVESEAREAALQHAGHFAFCRQQQALHLSSLMDRPPIIVSPYDAELFGHWWYEGPLFLDFLIRRLHDEQGDLELITPMEYLERHPQNQVAMPSMSSWGSRGYSEVWLEGSNDWIYRHLHRSAERLVALANGPDVTDPVRLRALNQLSRELLLAQSSDWAFIMKTQTAVRYAIQRTKHHLTAFNDLYQMVSNGSINEEFLADLETRDAIFPEIDYRVYRTKKA